MILRNLYALYAGLAWLGVGWGGKAPALGWIDIQVSGNRRGRFIPFRHAELVSASIPPHAPRLQAAQWILKQVQDDDFHGQLRPDFLNVDPP